MLKVSGTHLGIFQLVGPAQYSKSPSVCCLKERRSRPRKEPVNVTTQQCDDLTVDSLRCNRNHGSPTPLNFLVMNVIRAFAMAAAGVAAGEGPPTTPSLNLQPRHQRLDAHRLDTVLRKEQFDINEILYQMVSPEQAFFQCHCWKFQQPKGQLSGPLTKPKKLIAQTHLSEGTST